MTIVTAFGVREILANAEFTKKLYLMLSSLAFLLNDTDNLSPIIMVNA